MADWDLVGWTKRRKYAHKSAKVCLCKLIGAAVPTVCIIHEALILASDPGLGLNLGDSSNEATVPAQLCVTWLSRRCWRKLLE